MTTARAIVTLALRKLGRVGSGREPRPVDATDGFEALLSLYRGWINSGAFGRLADIMPTGNYVAHGNERILRTKGQTFEVTLPELVAGDSAQGQRYFGTVITVTENGDDVDIDVRPSQPLRQYARPPRDLSVVVISDTVTGNTIDFIYDGAQKKWVSLWDLVPDDEAPLSQRDAQGLASCLAVLISDQFGADIPATTAMQAAHYRSALVTRFSTPSTVATGVYF